MDLNKYLYTYYKKKLKYNHQVSLITDIYQDVIYNSVFVSIKGKKELEYIDKAIKNGAKTVFVEDINNLPKYQNINIIKVPSSKMELARLLREENKDFGMMPTLIGITGTNGKTTTTYLLYQYLKTLNYDVLLIGTNWIYSYYKMNEQFMETNNTTPSLSLLYKYLRNTKNEYDYVIMEVSSQGIEEGRTLGLKFDIVGITNLSREHLDYHHSLSEYLVVKGKILQEVKSCGIVILNNDDDAFAYFKNHTINKLLTFGLNKGMIKGKILALTNESTKFIISDEFKSLRLITNLIGKFNVYNLLMLYCINKSLNINNNYLKSFLNKKLLIPGRVNKIIVKDRIFIIDFAHTVDSVLNIINTVKETFKEGLIYTIIGCGGNRDKLKRPEIGKIVTELSDYAIFTEDNSRNENTCDIIEDITKDLTAQNYNIILDRKEAIKQAFRLSKRNDVILVLGKGAENYQIKKNNEKIKYSDIETVEMLKYESI